MLIDLLQATPEVFLAIAICGLLIFDGLTRGKFAETVHRLSVTAAMIVAVFCFSMTSSDEAVVIFNEMFVNDSFSFLLKGSAALAVAMTMVYSQAYLVHRDMYRGEFYAFALFALLGQMIMISANTMLMMYLGLELLSLSLYAAVALRRDHAASTEAAMKYFVLGALASGFLLYGMSMIYGATGSLELSRIASASVSIDTDKAILSLGLVFVVSGLAFKLGVVPFHMWVPDVYEGSPTPVTLLVSGAPKFAAFALTIRILVDGLLGFAADWQTMLMIVAVLSLVVGNLAAIMQKNIKRMLAYSTIAQMGFMLLGLASGVSSEGTMPAGNAYSASLFYVAIYVLTTLGTFGLILVLSRGDHEIEHIADLAGLNQRSPWLALSMLILMFSLAGIPPLAGFYAKLVVLQALLADGQIIIAVVAVMFSLVGAFYYLRVVKTMYFEEADQSPQDISLSVDARVLLAINASAVVALGIVPSPFMQLCSVTMLRILGS